MNPTFDMFTAVYPHAGVFDLARASIAFGGLSNGDRRKAIAGASLLGAELERLRLRPWRPDLWLKRRGWLCFADDELSKRAELLQRLTVKAVKFSARDGDPRHRNGGVSEPVGSFGSRDAEDKTQHLVVVEDVDPIAEDFERLTVERLPQGDFGSDRGVPVVGHFKAPSAGCGTPMVAESGAAAPSAAPGSARILCAGRAE